MLKLDGVSAGYDGSDVIHEISLSVGAGENLAIIGPNGCGKTTLLKAVAGLLPFTGDISIGGRPVNKMKRREAAKKVALLSQVTGIYFSYSVSDTVMMGRYPHISDKLLGLPSDHDRAQVARCLEAVSLTGEKDAEITKLSGGQLQRVFLARTLAQEPEIILLDEPTNHLDLKYQIELIEYLKEWASAGRRIVVGVMHDINLALRLGNRFLLMKNGRAHAFGTTEEVMTRANLEDTYGIDVAGYMRSSLSIWENI